MALVLASKRLGLCLGLGLEGAVLGRNPGKPCDHLYARSLVCYDTIGYDTIGECLPLKKLSDRQRNVPRTQGHRSLWDNVPQYLEREDTISRVSPHYLRRHLYSTAGNRVSSVTNCPCTPLGDFRPSDPLRCPQTMKIDQRLCARGTKKTWGIWIRCNTRFTGPTRVLSPNDISISSAVFAGLTNVTD